MEKFHENEKSALASKSCVNMDKSNKHKKVP